MLGFGQTGPQKLSYLQRTGQSTTTLSSEATQRISDIEEVRRRLVTGLLPFESILQTGQSHPYTLFTALTGLAAQGVAVSRGMYPPVFKTYRHEDVYASSQQLITFFEDVLNNIEESYLTVPFLQKERIFSFTQRVGSACFSPGSQSPTGNGGGGCY